MSRRVGRTLLVAVALFGVGTIVLGVTTSFAVAFVALLVLSGADAVSVFIRSTLVPLATPADKRGRVLAVEAVFIGASNELGAFESGVVGQLLGPGSAVVLGGVATLAVAALWWGFFPALRAVDGFPAAIDHDRRARAPRPGGLRWRRSLVITMEAAAVTAARREPRDPSSSSPPTPTPRSATTR